MKKLFLTFALVATPLFMTAQSFEFDQEGNRKGWNFGACEVAVEGGYYTLTIKDGKNPNIRKSKINAENAQYIHIVLKNESSANMIKFNFKDAAKKRYQENIEISTGDTEFKTYTIHAGAHEGWTGQTGPNLRFFEGKNLVNGKITIDKIILNNEPSL